MIKVSFANYSEALAVLKNNDDYRLLLNKKNKSHILKRIKIQDYEKVLSGSILSFSTKEKKILHHVINQINNRLKEKDLNLNIKILLIKTNGEDSLHLPYTRQNSIILPTRHLRGPLIGIEGLIAHELFHIISRKHKYIREPLYNSLGFIKENETLIDSQKVPDLMINPDACHYNYYIPVEYKQKTYKGVPLLLMKDQYKIALLNKNNTLHKIVSISQTNYFKNNFKTNYIIHPEEISAEYFRMFLYNDNIINKFKSFLLIKDPINSFGKLLKKVIKKTI